MKKIKRIGDLKLEQQRLHQRQAELQQAIRSDWQEIKEAMKLKNILKSRLGWRDAKDGKKERAKEVWIQALGFGAALLAGILAKRAEKKIETKLKEKIGAWWDRLFARKKKDSATV